MRKSAAYFGIGVLVIFLISLVMLVLHFQPIDPHSPGGIARLQSLAQTSRPVTMNIEQYHKRHGYYPQQITDLASYYSKKPRTRWGYEGWTVREDAQQYSLSILPGPDHDPVLRFVHHADGTGRWTYDPGDGGPETPLPFTIKVNP